MENAAADAVVVDNPYGIEAMWAQGDGVTRGTLIILLIMSAVSWYIIFSKLWDQRRLKAGAKVVEKQFWSSGSLKEAVCALPRTMKVASPIASICTSGSPCRCSVRSTRSTAR